MHADRRTKSQSEDQCDDQASLDNKRRVSAISIGYRNECDQGGKIYRSNIFIATEKLDKNKAEECGNQEEVADCLPPMCGDTGPNTDSWQRQ